MVSSRDVGVDLSTKCSREDFLAVNREIEKLPGTHKHRLPLDIKCLLIPRFVAAAHRKKISQIQANIFSFFLKSESLKLTAKKRIIKNYKMD